MAPFAPNLDYSSRIPFYHDSGVGSSKCAECVPCDYRSLLESTSSPCQFLRQIIVHVIIFFLNLTSKQLSHGSVI